jgi:hypothetical protein
VTGTTSFINGLNIKRKIRHQNDRVYNYANRVHCILFFPDEHYDLNKIVGNGKRFMAYELIKRLQEKGPSKILLRLKERLTDRDVAKGQKHKAFEDNLMQSQYTTVAFSCKR